MPEPKRPFLGPEHWRQTLAIIGTLGLPMLAFLAMFWADHNQLARNTEDLRSMIAAQTALDRRLTIAEGQITVVAANGAQLGGKMQILTDAVNQLTLGVQKLTDLLPESRHR